MIWFSGQDCWKENIKPPAYLRMNLLWPHLGNVALMGRYKPGIRPWCGCSPPVLRTPGAHIPESHPWLPLIPVSRGSVTSSCLLYNPQGTPQTLLSLSRRFYLSIVVWCQLQKMWVAGRQLAQSLGATLNKAKKQPTAASVCLALLFSPLEPSY